MWMHRSNHLLLICRTLYRADLESRFENWLACVLLTFCLEPSARGGGDINSGRIESEQLKSGSGLSIGGAFVDLSASITGVDFPLKLSSQSASKHW